MTLGIKPYAQCHASRPLTHGNGHKAFIVYTLYVCIELSGREPDNQNGAWW